MTTERPRLPLAAADQVLRLEVKRMQTVGHLRRTARDISGELFGVHDETAEVVAFQNALEKALDQFNEAMKRPAAALSYVAPDQVRSLLAAEGRASRVEVPTEVQ